MEQDLIKRDVIPFLRERMPFVDPQHMRFLKTWGNFVLGYRNRHIIKIPQGPDGREAFRAEITILNALHDGEFPVPIPEYEFVDPDYGCGMCRKLEGRPLDALTVAALSPERLSTCAAQLAAAIRRIHALPPEKSGFTVSRDFGADIELARNRTAKKLDFLGEFLTHDELASLRKRFDSFAVSAEDIRPVLGHQDLRDDNILFDDSLQELSGLLDFQDCEVADPATEFTPLFDIDPRFAELVVTHYSDDALLKERVSFFWFVRNVQCRLKAFKKRRKGRGQ